MADFEKLGAFYLGRGYDAAQGRLAAEPLMYDSRDLTTHAVCVGMTGSGKTGLCISLLEEAALDGIPAIAIDPKGDITNLLLAFPGLTAAEFQPWIEPAEAERRGTTVEALAAKTADAWKRGLAEWGEDGERIRRGLGPARPRRHRRRSAQEPRAHPAFRHHRRRLEQARAFGLGVVLATRVFLMRNVNDDAPTLFRTRWALSWLRGPLTLPEIARLMKERKTAEPPKVTGAEVSAPKAAVRPTLPAGVEEVFLAAKPGTGDLVYRPRVVATAELHYVDKPADIDHWRRNAWLAPLTDGDGAAFAELPAAALAAKSYAGWGKALAASLYQDGAVELRAAKALKLTSNPDESEGDFRARLGQALREHRDREVAKLREKYAARLKSLDDRIGRASDRIERDKTQYSQRKLDTAISIGASVLGAIFGGRSVATTRAGESLEGLTAERDDLLKQIEQAAGALTARLDPSSVALEKIRLASRKSDIAIARVGIAWEPWRAGADGFPRPVPTL